MNPGPLLFLATFFMMSVSWLGFVLVPQLQIGRQPQVQADAGLYPPMRPGMARQGEQVYRANGCFYCHTEQVRPRGFGSDVARGWGGRPGAVQSVDQDYLYDRPVMLGTQRIGPDLANIGWRQTNELLLLLHIYNPQLTTPKSVMPPYRYLFERRALRAGEPPSPCALPLADLAPNEEVVPTDDARALVAYLSSLHSDAVLFETPPPPAPATNAASSTNAVVAATNAPPSTNAPVAAAKSSATNAPAK